MHDVLNEIARPSFPPAHKRAPGSVTNKSRITNGKWILAGCDMRTPMGRRFRDLCEAYKSEAGGVISEAERGLIRQAAAMTLKAEEMQAKIVRGDRGVTVDDVVRLTSEARRTLHPIMTKSARHRASSTSQVEDLASYLRDAEAA